MKCPKCGKTEIQSFGWSLDTEKQFWSEGEMYEVKHSESIESKTFPTADTTCESCDYSADAVEFSKDCCDPESFYGGPSQLQNIIVIKRSNYERLIKGEDLIFDGHNFGLKKDLIVMFAENEEDANRKVSGRKVIRRTLSKSKADVRGLN